LLKLAGDLTANYSLLFLGKVRVTLSLSHLLFSLSSFPSKIYSYFYTFSFSFCLKSQKGRKVKVREYFSMI
jgi:hypothetical protein